MATRLDKIMEPILKEKCNEAFQAGYKKGLEDGWKNKLLAYENEINSLKYMLNLMKKGETGWADIKNQTS